MKLTPAQTKLLQRLTTASDWSPVHPAEYSVCRALFVRGLIDLVWGKGANRQFARPKVS